MKLDDAALKQILLNGSYVTEKDMAAAEAASQANHASLVENLLSAELLNQDLLGQAIAESFRVTYANLHLNPPTVEQVQRIPQDVAQTNRVIFLSEEAGNIQLTTDDPTQTTLGEALKKLFADKKITIHFSLPDEIDAALALYRKSLDTRFSKIIEGQKHIAPELINEILSDALTFHASDIHFEPRHNNIIVRFRVDGVLQEAGRLSREHYENMLNRIKVQSRLRIDEHFAAQDGSMRFEQGNVAVDLRTSIVPTVEGEKVVLRVLAAYVQGLTLNDLGLSDHHQQLLEKAANKPFGMILVVGPTGSGKTTTLYALLKMLNQPGENITTIEDPVEYKVVGINQIQVNLQTNLTFAKGLRSIVRQDPDIILVGEIRDEETAEIAINAALTGHLLLSTFHANDAATAIPRLCDMGIEPYLLASTLDLVVAQRLTRRICDHCRKSEQKTPEELKVFGPVVERYFGDATVTLYRGNGCDACGHTGFKGRTAIHEMIQITPEMQALMLKSPSTQEIWNLARTQGAISLFEDGLEKVQNGVTTLEELLRVAEPPKEAPPSTLPRV
jgi:type IV pilus assembly protein PilB